MNNRPSPICFAGDIVHGCGHRTYGSSDAPYGVNRRVKYACSGCEPRARNADGGIAYFRCGHSSTKWLQGGELHPGELHLDQRCGACQARHNRRRPLRVAGWSVLGVVAALVFFIGMIVFVSADQDSQQRQQANCWAATDHSAPWSGGSQRAEYTACLSR